MTVNCCADIKFKRLTDEASVQADPGSTEGVEFTIGTCATCGKLLMHCWIGGGVALECVVVDAAIVERLHAEPDVQKRKRLLSDWWNSL